MKLATWYRFIPIAAFFAIIALLSVIMRTGPARAVPPIENTISAGSLPFNRPMFRADSNPAAGRYNRTITIIRTGRDSTAVFLQQKYGAVRFSLAGGDSGGNVKVYFMGGYYPASGTPRITNEDNITYTSKGSKSWEFLTAPCFHGYLVFEGTAANDTTVISGMDLTTDGN
jgi:hypothetical protein